MEVTLPVIKVSQPLGDFFIGSIDAKALVQISYADVRRIENEQRDVEKYLGIQRPLDKTRIKKIQQYLQSPDATFPTGVVLAVDDRCAEFDPASGRLTLKPYESDFDGESIPLSKVAKVLDGQHRIYAFTNDSGDFNENLFGDPKFPNFEFNVVIFIGIDIDEQANIFATVNLAQTKVNRSLVYDLEGLSSTPSPFKTCHHIAVALDSLDPNGPLYHRIKRLGVKTKGREQAEPLTQAAFVESLLKLISPDPFKDRTELMKGKTPKKATPEELLKFPFRNLFLEERDNDIAVIIYNYFTAIKNRWPDSWAAPQKQGNLLPKSNAFKALMRYLKIIYLEIVGNQIGRIVTVDEFAQVFAEYQITDNDFTTGAFKPGSGGEAAFFKLLKGETTIQDLKEDN